MACEPISFIPSPQRLKDPKWNEMYPITSDYVSFAQQDATGGSAPVQLTGADAAKVMNAGNALYGLAVPQQQEQPKQTVPLSQNGLMIIPGEITEKEANSAGLANTAQGQDGAGGLESLLSMAEAGGGDYAGYATAAKNLLAAFKNRPQSSYVEMWRQQPTLRIPSYMLGR